MSEPDATSATSTSPPTSPAPTSAPPATSPSSTVPTSGAAEQAAADLAELQGVEPSAIVTIAVDNVTWRDASLGCPRKGMQYAQVLTDGVRIVLELDGKRYQYHGGGGRPPFYCARPEPPVGES